MLLFIRKGSGLILCGDGGIARVIAGRIVIEQVSPNTEAFTVTDYDVAETYQKIRLRLER